MKVQLVVVQGKPEGMVIPLASPRYKIGRGEGCQLRPNSDLVSREHAEFVQEADSVTVRDMGSRNGTEVNGKRLAANTPVSLKSGDLIKVGTLTFAITIEGVPTTKSAGSPGGAGRKVSLDDVSNDEIDSWLVSDPSRPTPERPSGVYGGDTMTLETFKDQEGPKAKSVPTPRPAPPRPAPPAPPAPAPAPPPVAAQPVAPAPPPPPLPVPPAAPVAPHAPEPPTVVAPPLVAGLAQPTAAAPEAPPAYFPSPEPIAPPVAAATPPPPPPAPAPAPPPAPKVEAPQYNPIFNFLANEPDLPDVEEESNEDGEAVAQTPQDDIPDFSSLSNDDDDDEGSAPSGPSAEDFIDESNPFYAKKPEAAPAAAAKAQPKDSSAAADDILRKIMDRRRARS